MTSACVLTVLLMFHLCCSSAHMPSIYQSQLSESKWLLFFFLKYKTLIFYIRKGRRYEVVFKVPTVWWSIITGTLTNMPSFWRLHFLWPMIKVFNLASVVGDQGDLWISGIIIYNTTVFCLINQTSFSFCNWRYWDPAICSHHKYLVDLRHYTRPNLL